MLLLLPLIDGLLPGACARKHVAQQPILRRTAAASIHMAAEQTDMRVEQDEVTGTVIPRARISSLFKEYDTSGDGLIDMSELQAALSKAGKPITPQRAEAILQLVDSNGDGEISLDEFKLVFNLDAIFKEYDTSGDGFIDESELQAALAKAGRPITAQRAEEILQLVDSNGDGQISLEEFKLVFSLDAPDSLRGLASTLDLAGFIEEVRTEVEGTPFNGPILLTAFTAASVGFFWKYIVALSLLYQSSSGASWLPESLQLLQTIPGGFLADYAQAVELAPLLTMACTSAFAYAMGDLVAQRVEGRAYAGAWRVELLDLGRCARNALLGFSLHGPLVYGWIQVLEGEQNARRDLVECYPLPLSSSPLLSSPLPPSSPSLLSLPPRPLPSPSPCISL